MKTVHVKTTDGDLLDVSSVDKTDVGDGYFLCYGEDGIQKLAVKETAVVYVRWLDEEDDG